MREAFGVVAFAAFGTPASAGMISGPSPYLSEADSLFSGFAGFELENFEDGSLDLAGVTASAGAPINPSGFTDSVDGDDGSIDGSGTFGRSFFFGNGSVGITFSFATGPDDPFITAAGLVWTDGAGTITFEAYDRMGNLIGSVDGTHADAGFGGGTAEDRFYGVTHGAGIGSIFIRNSGGGIEVDHLQYAVPAPASAGVLGVMVATLRRRR